MRRRLVLVTLATTTMIALAFVLPLALLVRDVAEERALTRGRQVATSLAPVLLTGDDAALQVALSGVDASLSTTVVLPDRRAVGAALPSDVDLSAAWAGAASVERTDGADVLVTPVIRPGVGTSVVVVVVPDAVQRQGVLASWVILGVLAVVLVGGAVALADRLGRGVTRPAADLVTTARRLGGGDLAARARREGPPEVADIADALNQLAERIEGLVRSEREAVADMSHRLRTPLTALRLDVEGVSSAAERERLTADLDALERSVDRLIRDARLGADASAHTPSTDVVPVVRERCTWWAALAEDQGRTALLSVDVEHAPTPVTPQALTDALDALLGNVFAHTAEGTAYAVEVERRDGEVRIAVADRGPGLPPAVGRERGDSRAGSTGLGLDIARRVAEGAGGRLELDHRREGARVVLVLPLVEQRN